MNGIELAVFDMAGTTVNENNVVYKTVQKSLKDAGYDVSLEMVLEHGAGKEKRNAIAHIIDLISLNQVDSELIDEIFKKFREDLKLAYDNMDVTSYEGVEELFKHLRSKGIKVVLNTGYDQKTAQKLLQKLEWQIGEHVDDVITADDVKVGRPSAEMIQLAMKKFAIADASKVLKAGDSVIDIEEGKNANCGLTVGVLTGAQTREQLQMAEPSLILDNLSALKEVL